MQYGGGNCSLCHSPGTNKSTCPLNPAVTNPNYEKHPNAMAAATAATPAPVPVQTIVPVRSSVKIPVSLTPVKLQVPEVPKVPAQASEQASAQASAHMSAAAAEDKVLSPAMKGEKVRERENRAIEELLLQPGNRVEQYVNFYRNRANILKTLVELPTLSEIEAAEKEAQEAQEAQGAQGDHGDGDHGGIVQGLTLEGLDDYSLMNIIDVMDYSSVRALAQTNKRFYNLVYRLADVAIENLHLPPNIDRVELLEKVYHLNSYKKPSWKGIVINKKPGRTVWRKGRNSIIIENDVSGRKEVWLMKGKEHRLYGPARQAISHNTKLLQWLQNGQLHRVDGPAYQVWEMDNLAEAAWYIKGILHRIGGPAKTTFRSNYQDAEWYKMGKRHRLDGPAVHRWYEGHETMSWYQNGERHRSGTLPAHYEFDIKTLLDLGTSRKRVEIIVCWYIRNQVHRRGGPAKLEWHDDKLTYATWNNHGHIKKEWSAVGMMRPE